MNKQGYGFLKFEIRLDENKIWLERGTTELFNSMMKDLNVEDKAIIQNRIDNITEQVESLQDFIIEKLEEETKEEEVNE